MLVSNFGRGDVGGGPGRGGYVCHLTPKQYIPIYSESSDIGAVSGGGAATGNTGDQEMVGAGRLYLKVARVAARAAAVDLTEGS